jgi:predicted outer membrane repeat protein
MLMLRVQIAVAMIGLVSAAHVVSAATIYVDDSAITGANNGTNWENAYIELHDGLNIAQRGDEVRVAQGLYRPVPPNGDRAISFQLRSGVIVQGGYAGCGAPNPDALDAKKFITVLSGDLNGDDGPVSTFANFDENSYHVVMADGVTEAQLRGVTITGGNANFPSNCKLGSPHVRGGGLLLENAATVLLHQIIFEANQVACSGGAIALLPSDCVLDVEDSIFRWNRRKPIGGGAGGAISGTFGTVSVFNCLFENNGFWVNVGGAIAGVDVVRASTFIHNVAGEGGAISDVREAVIDCTFIDNESGLLGGAIYSGGFDLINCAFRNNKIDGSSGGAAVYATDVRVINCLFSGHDSVALTITDDSPEPNAVINSTFVGNNSFSSSGAINGGPVQIANCILWDNTGTADSVQQQQLSVAGTISNTIIEGWDGTLGGTNNSGEDPLFVDADGADDQYGTDDDNPRLSAKSPAIDAGDNSALPGDDFDLDDDGDTAEQIPLDLDLHARVVNDTVDLGPFEFSSEPVECVADIAPVNGNGTVDVDDLLLVINNWNAAGENPADVTGNGVVDVDDLLAVINDWGECE